MHNKYILYSISYLLILFGLYRLIILLITIKRLKQGKYIKEQVKNIDYFFILPVYNETTLIRDTIKHYENIIKRFPNAYLIIVGTCNERDNLGKNRTLELAKKYLSNKMIIIESDKAGGSMATQINFAVKYIQNILNKDINTTYIHIINIDSRVSSKSVDEVFYHISNGEKILLQSTLFISNYNKLNWFTKGVSIYQSRRTLVEEQYRILFHNNVCKHKLYHVVGHGLIIRLTEYLKYKMFPEDTINEDLHFGFYLSLNNEKVLPLTSYEYGDTPMNFREWFKQTISWFYGNIEYYKYPQLYMQKFGESFSCKLLIFTLQGFINSIKRFITSYYLRILLILSIIYTNYLGFLGIFMYFIHYAIFSFWLSKTHNIKLKVKEIFGLICIPFVVSVPLTISILKYILFKIGVISFIKNKTNHG